MAEGRRRVSAVFITEKIKKERPGDIFHNEKYRKNEQKAKFPNKSLDLPNKQGILTNAVKYRSVYTQWIHRVETIINKIAKLIIRCHNGTIDISRELSH